MWANAKPVAADTRIERVLQKSKFCVLTTTLIRIIYKTDHGFAPWMNFHRRHGTVFTGLGLNSITMDLLVEGYYLFTRVLYTLRTHHFLYP